MAVLPAQLATRNRRVRRAADASNDTGGLSMRTSPSRTNAAVTCAGPNPHGGPHLCSRSCGVSVELLTSAKLDVPSRLQAWLAKVRASVVFSIHEALHGPAEERRRGPYRNGVWRAPNQWPSGPSAPTPLRSPPNRLHAQLLFHSGAAHAARTSGASRALRATAGTRSDVSRNLEVDGASRALHAEVVEDLPGGLHTGPRSRAR
jgi:hypothetical protein